MFAFFKDELKALFLLQPELWLNILWNVFFLFAVRKWKGFLKFCKLISNLIYILGQMIVSNLTNVHELNSRRNYARLHEIRYKRQTSNAMITQAYHSRCSENHQVRPESLQIFQPSYASSKVKNENDAIRNRISDFDKRRFSQPKTQ